MMKFDHLLFGQSLSLIELLSPSLVRRRKTTYHKPHGQRECTRRRRQIILGELRLANGLDADARDRIQAADDKAWREECAAFAARDEIA